jgi:hypothetical protein
MKIAFAIVSAFLLLAGNLSAQPAPGVPPVFKVVSAADEKKGQIEFVETTTRVVPEQRAVVKEIVEIQNGMQVKRAVTETVTVYVMVMVQEISLIDAAKTRVMTPDGKQLPIEDVWRRLKKDTVVLVSSDGKTPAQAYLKALNAETLVVIAPQPMPQIGPAPIPPKEPPPPKAPPVPEKIAPPPPKN